GPAGLVVQVVTADEAARVCPECGTWARRSKGRRVTRPRDLQVGGRRPQLVWTKRRWRCDQRACRRGSVTGAGGAVGPGQRATGGWQATVDRWHVGFVDLSAGQGLLGQVEGRNAQVVIDWLTARDQSWRDAVRYVAIDMCTIFKSAIHRALPAATVVVDHFHL